MIGTVIGLSLLFGKSLEQGVLIMTLDVYLNFLQQPKGFRKIEAFTIAMTGVIFASFAIHIALTILMWCEVIKGFKPTTNILTKPNIPNFAFGIIGAFGAHFDISH